MEWITLAEIFIHSRYPLAKEWLTVAETCIHSRYQLAKSGKIWPKHVATVVIHTLRNG